MKDTFIKDYWTLETDQQTKIRDLKDKAQELHNMMLATNIDNREMNIAKTNLEQAMMWCTKAIVLLNIPEDRT